MYLRPVIWREFRMKFIVNVVNKKDDALPLVDVLVTSGYRAATFKTAG